MMNKNTAWYGRNEAMSKRAYGSTFEEKAQQFLEKIQYRVLAKNVTYPCGEIDLVAEVGSGNALTLVFVEVRKRDPRSWIRPEETITYPKQRTLKNAIARFLIHYEGKAQNIRIDLLAFDGVGVRHFPDFIRY